jgi:hypothetical protein
VVIDSKIADIDEAANFWSQALNKKVKAPTPDFPNYREFEVGDTELLILVQKVEHESRVHLDIEADDVEAEVRRLEALGAKRVHKVRTWWVLEAPTGQRFCVVRLQRGPLGNDATLWSDDGRPIITS